MNYGNSVIMKQIERQKEKGAIAVEAVFIIPIVCVVAILLIYMALFQMQKGVMYLQAYKSANKVAHILANPGYQKLYTGAYTNGNDGGNTLDFPYKYALANTTALKESYQVHNPYRYWGYIFSGTTAAGTLNGNLNSPAEQELQEVLANVSFLNVGTAMIPTITIDPGIITTTVNVTIRYQYTFPKFMNLIGLEGYTMMEETATAHVTDACEFIRNTDIAVDLTDFLLEKLGGKNQKLGTFMNKAKEYIKKFLG